MGDGQTNLIDLEGQQRKWRFRRAGCQGRVHSGKGFLWTELGPPPKTEAEVPRDMPQCFGLRPCLVIPGVLTDQ